MGAEAIKTLLEEIDLEKESTELKDELGDGFRPEACAHFEAPGGLWRRSVSPATARSG